jgi:hypothetical protein
MKRDPAGIVWCKWHDASTDGRGVATAVATKVAARAPREELP